jgi:DNA-binding MarR family transcriptional regulator
LSNNLLKLGEKVSMKLDNEMVRDVNTFIIACCLNAKRGLTTAQLHAEVKKKFPKAKITQAALARLLHKLEAMELLKSHRADNDRRVILWFK